MHLKIPRRARVLTAAAVAAAVLAYLALPGLRAGVDDVVGTLMLADTGQAVRAFRDTLLSFGVWAPVVSALLMVLQSVIAPLPAFVITFANGLLFGWAWGALLSWSAAMVGAWVCFWIARSLGRPVVERLVGGSHALEVSDLFFDRWGPQAILVCRLLPFVSFDLISYAAGLTPVSQRRFLLATGVGQMPATLLYAYLGQHLSGSVQVLFWVFSATMALFVVGAAVGPRVIRRLRQPD